MQLNRQEIFINNNRTLITRINHDIRCSDIVKISLSEYPLSVLSKCFITHTMCVCAICLCFKLIIKIKSTIENELKCLARENLSFYCVPTPFYLTLFISANYEVLQTVK